MKDERSECKPARAQPTREVSPTEYVIQNRMPWASAEEPDQVVLLTREWLVTNGLGGYASTSVSGACTRRYHGLLIAALPAPLGRMVLLSHFGEEMAMADDSIVNFGGEDQTEDHLELHSARYLTEFRLEAGLPVWRFDVQGCIIEKRLWMPHFGGRCISANTKRPFPCR
jgi:glycogen debranching enzyme